MNGGLATNVAPVRVTTVATSSGTRQGSPKIKKLPIDAKSGLNIVSTVESPIGIFSTDKKENAIPPKPNIDLKNNIHVTNLVFPNNFGPLFAIRSVS
mmetsp:Transcript_21547/g.30869  ORF Transcript_21547/g.30869 Transcript_21547/m.30869 type:complete len:97 (+) Transcript_21547:363-653(+)